MPKLLAAAALPLLVFNIFYWPLEYLLIQRLFYPERFIPYISSVLIFVLIMISGWLYIKKLFPTSSLKIVIIFIFTLLLAAGSYHYFYRLTRDFYLHPVIHELKPAWGIQDTIIVIKGDRFMNDGQKGEVFFGDELLLIDKWEDHKIVGHLPVPRTNRIKVKAYIVRADGRQSNQFDFFYLADPDEIEEITK